MPNILTKKATDLILGGLIKDVNSPFIQENETIYLKYNSISIRKKGNKFTFSFNWNGCPLSVNTEKTQCAFSKGDTLTIANIEGRQKFNIV